MPTEQPISNVKLTLEQLQQLEVVETRLGNLQNEIKIGTRQLQAVTNDSVRITKEKEYQQCLLSKLEEQVKVAQGDITRLNEQKLSLSDDLNHAKEELSEVRSSSDRKMAEITEQVKLHEAKEAELVTRETSIASAEYNYENRNSALQAKINRINEAING